MIFPYLAELLIQRHMMLRKQEVRHFHDFLGGRFLTHVLRRRVTRSLITIFYLLDKKGNWDKS